MDNMGERIATVSFKWQSTVGTYEMVGRRIMLEQGKPFVSGNDNSYLYFCGFSYANSESRRGDIVFGRISSKDLNTYANEAALILDKQNAIKIEIVFRYGSSTDTEYTFTAWNEVPNKNGDCALTSDNAYIVGVFSTAHQKGSWNDIPYGYSYALTTTQNAYDNPLSYTQQSCDNMQATSANLFTWFMANHQTPPTTKTTQASWCENYYTSQMRINRDNYKLAYSWRQCGYSYYYQLHSPTCSISGITFGDCDTYSSSWDDSHLSQHDNGAYTIQATCAANAGDCPPNSCGTFVCSEEACNQGRLNSCRWNKNRPLQWNYFPTYGTICFPTPAASPNTCCQDCTRFVGDYNTEGFWYPSLNSGCKDWEFRRNGYDQVIAIDPWWNPYIYCEEKTNPPTEYCQANTAFINTLFNTDTMYIFFEQDCRDSGASVNTNMFIYRIDLTKLVRAGTSTGYSIPDAAVYFGDGRGLTFGQAIAVDEYGFIYVHGYSTSPTFGGLKHYSCCSINAFGAVTSCCGSHSWNWRSVWIHLKTHWELTHEIQHDANLGLFSEMFPGYQSKKFIQPRRFRNDATYTFLDLLYDSTCPTLSPFPAQCASTPFLYTLTTEIMRGVPINARTYTLTTSPSGSPVQDINSYYQGHSLISVVGAGASQWANSGKIWGYSYSRMNPIQELRLNISSIKQQFSITLPQVCMAYDILLTTNSNPTNKANQPKKIRWETKNQTFTDPVSYDNSVLTPTTLTNLVVKILNYSGSTYSESHLSGTIPVTVTKGKYYMTLRSGTHYYLYTRPTTYSCSPGMKDYGYFMNTMNEPAHRRFESSVRIKLIVDRADSSGPLLLYNIDDIKPIVGQRYLYQIPITTYFSGCDRMRARRAYDNSGTYKTHQLPFWIKYHERNSTFIFYPDQVSSIVDIQLTCCNVINQCISTSFRVLPQNNLPKTSIVSYMDDYLIQLDGTMGQYFQWQMRSTDFWDQDKASTSTGNQFGADDTTYKLTDHRVFLDFTPAVPGFRFLQSVGLFFGQATTQHIAMPALTGQYQFYDFYSQNLKQYGSFSILVNQIPQVTSLGQNYIFPTLDPTYMDDTTTTFFDKFFPFLRDETIQSRGYLLVLDVSQWFTNTSQVTYTMNSTDNSGNPPFWMSLDPNTGQLIMDPPSDLPSQLMQVMFTVSDLNRGTASLKKSIMINTPPKVVSTYHHLKLALNRQINLDLSWMLYDSDSLTYSTDSNTVFQKYGLEFHEESCRVTGKPWIKGRSSRIKITGVDTHGASATTYITFEIEDYTVQKRDKMNLNDVQIYQNQPFAFKIRDDTFYDQQSYQTLVRFATDLGDQQLPSWIKFDPTQGLFYGTAPSVGQSQQIRIRAMNQISHDTTTSSFKITTIAIKTKPKPSLYRTPKDLIYTAGDYFIYSFPKDAFKLDKALKAVYQISLSQVPDSQIPPYISFNPDNLTIQGVIPSTITQKTILRFDLVLNGYASHNLKLTIMPKVLVYKLKYQIIGSVCVFMAGILFFAYLFHFILLTPAFRQRHYLEKIEASKRRFGTYQDINVKFIQVVGDNTEDPDKRSRSTNLPEGTLRNSSARSLLSDASDRTVRASPDFAPEGEEFKPPEELQSAQDENEEKETESERTRQIRQKVQFADEVENIGLPEDQQEEDEEQKS